MWSRTGAALVSSVLLIAIFTYFSLLPTPQTLGFERTRTQYFDRIGVPLSYSRSDNWNFEFLTSIAEAPELLVSALIQSEDRRFFQHNGVDLKAIASAVLLNLRSLRFLRGGSTISEQVVRIIHPRSRTLWSRWLEAIEAIQLESRFSKQEILNFYINQVPLPRNSRGFKMAAARVFGRDLSTLSRREMLALVVMLRAPGKLDPIVKGSTSQLNPRIERLSSRVFPLEERSVVLSEPLSPARLADPPDARHFLRSLNRLEGQVTTTIDSALQSSVQKLLNERLRFLSNRSVSDGAVLIVDNSNSQIMSWVNGGLNRERSEIDAVLTTRQPGSTLKPLLYAYAIERGWTPETVIDDSELSLAVGHGLKAYQNYSQKHYGPVPLHIALGNSLNIPAVRTVQHFGVQNFYQFLRTSGLDSLSKGAEHYGEGLALGNGEVSLFELVRAYSALANGGIYRELVKVIGDKSLESQIVSATTASTIAKILSSPDSRRLEFDSKLMNFPIQTAIKTGTSTGYHDAWALGFSANYTIGVWLGNLDRKAMSDVSGASGAVLLLRAIFREAEKRSIPKGLRFHKGPDPTMHNTISERREADTLRVRVPTPGLIIAMDPRVPLELQVLGFEANLSPVSWELDGVSLGESHNLRGKFLWQPQIGKHRVVARTPDGRISQAVRFEVR